jgi:hypothetical protein
MCSLLVCHISPQIVKAFQQELIVSNAFQSLVLQLSPAGKIDLAQFSEHTGSHLCGMTGHWQGGRPLKALQSLGLMRSGTKCTI